MNFFAMGSYIPLHQAGAGATDLRTNVALVVVMAIVLTASIVYASRSVKKLRSRGGETVDAERKAA
jgi:hypothetical protein